jgi:hypothetical protein
MVLRTALITACGLQPPATDCSDTNVHRLADMRDAKALLWRHRALVRIDFKKIGIASKECSESCHESFPPFLH